MGNCFCFNKRDNDKHKYITDDLSSNNTDRSYSDEDISYKVLAYNLAQAP